MLAYVTRNEVWKNTLLCRTPKMHQRYFIAYTLHTVSRYKWKKQARMLKRGVRCRIARLANLFRNSMERDAKQISYWLRSSRNDTNLNAMAKTRNLLLNTWTESRPQPFDCSRSILGLLVTLGIFLLKMHFNARMYQFDWNGVTWIRIIVVALHAHWGWHKNNALKCAKHGKINH